MTQSRRSGWQAVWGHCHSLGMGQGREMGQEKPYAALQKESSASCSWSGITQASVQALGKRMTWGTSCP